MDLYEYQGKELFRQFGIPVSEGRIASTPGGRGAVFDAISRVAHAQTRNIDFDTTFSPSEDWDLHFRIGYTDAVGNTSVGSNCFFDFSTGHTWGSPVSLTGNRVLDPTGDWAVRLDNAGPYLVADNAFRLRGAARGVRMTWGDQTLVGPNCPGVISPGVATVGIMPTQVFTPGRVGLVSRSGTLTYQISKELALLGIGQSTVVGIGGDPVVGSSFIDILGRFEADPDTDLVVMVGEIGGAEEENAADFIAANMSTPVVGYVAGFQAPPGKQMGHAGAIITGSSGTAQAKKEALEARGVRVGESPTAVAALVKEALGS